MLNDPINRRQKTEVGGQSDSERRKVNISMEERRKYQRVNTVNLLSYVSLDENGKPLEQGMGKTLDISQGGLLMETKIPINAQYILLVGINISDELIEIRGEVAYSRQTEPKIFHSGIRFSETSEKLREVVVELIKVFHQQKGK